jgi:glycosyltransferase involved in cell wall biosynthesis
VTITQKTPVSRQELGLDPDKYLFMFVFDVASVMERKNPLALVEAYRNAFRGDDRVQLAFKITRSSFDPVGVARLKAEVASVGGVVIDRDLPRDQAYGVLDACDCYVSLHRSEGYGITIAEAMLMGKPTIATGYSGNVDFMSEEDTFMIPYKLEPIKIDLPYYPRGCHWATADTHAAAERMRWVFEHQGEAKSMGLKASARVSELIGMKAYGARIMDRVRAIRLEKQGLLRHQIAY